MSVDRGRVDEICDAALERSPEQREAYLDSACGADVELRREVDSLLKHAQAASSFLSAPVAQVAAAVLDSSASRIGTRIGQYEIRSRLGRGGMGEVYRAHDTTLGREVAIKTLPASFAADPERMARFEREARVLAALNHPNVATIHGVETADDARVLVLELIEGETLAERIARGSVPFDDSLLFARQIADALEAAHGKGIVHRDLKPGNIMITGAGAVKVLDFGLATGSPASEPAFADAPTVTVGATREGTVLGTAAYMSPEQTRGQAVDKRTDIWAFGCVLYEMLTGQPAFGGSTVSDHIAAILGREPDWTLLPREMPASVTRVLRRCLAKNAHNRVHDIADVRIEIDEVLDRQSTEGTRSTSVAMPRPRLVAVAAMAAVAGALATLLTVAWLPVRSGAGSAQTSRSVVVASPGTYLTETIGPSVAISRDGSMVAFAAVEGERSRLFLRRIASLEATPIAGTEGGIELISLAHAPEFSPDGQWLAFAADGLLKKIAVSGGAAQTLGAAPGLKSVMWTDDSQLLISDILQKGLTVMAASGGVKKQITTYAPDETSHRAAVVLPGGKALLMTVWTDTMHSWDDARIEGVVLATSERKILVSGGMQPRYLPTGHLLYARAGRLLAVPFDANRLEVGGTPKVVMDGVNTDSVWGYANFAVSSSGSLVYTPGGANTRPSSLFWLDRAGRAELVTDLDQQAYHVRISPDGIRAAVGVDTGRNEIWTLDIRRSILTKLVSGEHASQPIWMTDGSQILFGSSRGRRVNGNSLLVQAVDGTSGPTASEIGASGYPNEWSSGDRLLLFTKMAGRGLMYWSRESRQAREVPNSGNARGSRLSPDGAWVAFQSDETGRDEVFVQTFPGGLARWRVSARGGRFPVWSRDGHELFFVENGEMVAASVTVSSGKLQTSTPVRLFNVKGFLLDESSYDVSPAGRFLMIRREPHNSTQLNLVQNWFAELRSR